MKSRSLLASLLILSAFLFLPSRVMPEPRDDAPPFQGPGEPELGAPLPGADNAGGREDARKAFFIQKFFEKEMPEFLEKLKKTKEDYPDAADKFLREMREKKKDHFMFFAMSRESRGSKETKALAQKLLENELESYVLAEKYISSSDEKEKASLLESLRSILISSFDTKEKIQASAVKNMEERIQKLKDMMEKRKDLKDKIIEERMQLITSDGPVTEW